jgi:hypothetical protein
MGMRDGDLSVWRLGNVPWPAFAVVAAIGVWAITGFQGIGSLRSEYTCDNIIPDVINLSSDHLGATQPRKLIKLDKKYEITKSDTEIACRGEALWSDGATGRVDYRAFRKKDDWLISFEPVT